MVYLIPHVCAYFILIQGVNKSKYFSVHNRIITNRGFCFGCLGGGAGNKPAV